MRSAGWRSRARASTRPCANKQAVTGWSDDGHSGMGGVEDKMYNANQTVPRNSNKQSQKKGAPWLLLLTLTLTTALCTIAAVAAYAQDGGATAAETAQRGLVDLGQVFTYFFVMLGP